MLNISNLIQKQEDYWDTEKKLQCLDEKSIWYGGFNPAISYGTWSVLFSALFEALPLYCDPRSNQYKSEALLYKIQLNSEFLLKYQHRSGLISLRDCNIESPPDTAFMVNDLCICHFYIEKVNLPELNEIDKNILTFLERTKKGLITGGFHTPNHRWVICCALGMLYKIFGDEALKVRAGDYLNEGIDINEDGEWTERSNGVYNAVSDLYMIHIGEIWGVERAFEAVIKNLDMMKYLLHPDDYIVTEYSTRQDRGQIASLDARYTIAYQLMAARKGDGEYVYIAERAVERADKFGRILMYAELYKDEMLADIPAMPVSDQYIKMINRDAVTKVPKAKSNFGDSVLRYRNKDLSITLMAGQPDFLFFQYGEARIFGIRFTAGWFGMGGISFPGIEEIGEKKFRMSTVVKGKYWQVLPRATAEAYQGNFDAMPNETREDIGKVEFFAECIVTLLEDGLELELTTRGFDFLYTQLVCMFDKTGQIYGEDIDKMNEWVNRQNSGKSVYTAGNSAIELQGSGAEHDIAVIRGDTLNKEAQNLTFNMVAPENKKIVIRHR